MPKINSNKNNGYFEISVHLQGDNWKSLLEKARKRAFANLEIKGFRKGQVPANIAANYINAAKVRQDALDLLIREKNDQLMDQMKNEKIAGRPTVNIKKLSDEEVEFVVTTSLAPEITIKHDKYATNSLKDHTASKEEIEFELKQLDTMFTTKEEVKDANHKIAKGDIVNFNFVGKIDGKEFEGGKADHYDLEIGSKMFIEGFEEQMIGLKVGDHKTIKVTFPKVYPSKEVAGKDAEFDIKVNSIKAQKSMSEEEITKKAKAMGFETKKDIESMLETMVHDRKLDTARNVFFNQLVKEIIEHPETKLHITEELLLEEARQELKILEEKLAKQFTNINAYLKMLNKTHDQLLKEDMVTLAKNRLSSSLVFEHLLNKHNIKLVDADFDKEYEKMAKAQRTSVDKIKKQISKESIANALLFNKLIDTIATK